MIGAPGALEETSAPAGTAGAHDTAVTPMACEPGSCAQHTATHGCMGVVSYMADAHPLHTAHAKRVNGALLGGG